MHWLSLLATCLTWQVFGMVIYTLQKAYGFSFFSTSPYFCSWWISISFFKGLHIHLCDQCLGLFSIIDKWLDIVQAWSSSWMQPSFLLQLWYAFQGIYWSESTTIDYISDATLHWTLGFIVVVPIFNVLHIFLIWHSRVDVIWTNTCLWINICVPLIRFFFCGSFSQTESMLTFDLNIFEKMLSWIMIIYWF
jgi:hypothetical protein